MPVLRVPKPDINQVNFIYICSPTSQITICLKGFYNLYSTKENNEKSSASCAIEVHCCPNTITVETHQ